MAKHRLVILAFGTRGDVQPLALLALGLLQDPTFTIDVQVDDAHDDNHQQPPLQVYFLTHAQHESFVKDLWKSSTSTSTPLFVGSPSPPHAAGSGSGGNQHSQQDDGDEEKIEEILRPAGHLDVCIGTCQGALLLIANMFALEAVHIAEAIHVPLTMAHPYPAPSHLPPHFARRFRLHNPQTYLALHQRAHQQQASFKEISWEDVENWMWPIYTDAWADLRTRLGLSEVPCLIGRPSIPVLYLYSESVLPRPGYWPEQVHVAGYLWPPIPEEYQPPPSLQSFLNQHNDNAADHNPETYYPQVGPIFITFGTMVSLGALGKSEEEAAQALAQALGYVAKATKKRTIESTYRFLIDAAGQPAWAKALRDAFGFDDSEEEGSKSAFDDDVLVLEESVPHTWLLPKCSVIVHHGGSGTTAAALRAGIAQVVIPMMMDQFTWAERLAWLDLGPPPLALEFIFPSSSESAVPVSSSSSSPSITTTPLLDALDKASHPLTRLRAASYGKRLRSSEKGPTTTALTRCIELIKAHLLQWQCYLKNCPSRKPSPPSRPPLPTGCELMTLEHEDGDELVVAALKGSEAEVTFLHQEIFPPRHGERECGYLKHGIQVKEGDIIVDIGANIGLFALFLELWVMDEPGQINVITIEPSPRTYEALVWNLCKYFCCNNDQVPKWKAIKKAVGKTVGRANLRFFPHMPGNSTMDSTRGGLPTGINPRIQAHLLEGAEELEVEMSTLSDIMTKEGMEGSLIHLLKVDVEGMEDEVLEGIDANTWSNIQQVVSEVHDVDGRKDRIDRVLRFQGSFEHVMWEKPAWTKSINVDNWMVYATRRR